MTGWLWVCNVGGQRVHSTWRDYINGLRRENERLKIANAALDVDKARKYMECLLMERELEELKKDHEIIVNDNLKKTSKIARYERLIVGFKE